MTRLPPPGQISLDGRAMTEAALQRHVITQARSLGWGITQASAERLAADAAAFGIEPPALEGLVFHPRYSLGSEPGWPDLTLVRRRDRRPKVGRDPVAPAQCLYPGIGPDERTVLGIEVHLGGIVGQIAELLVLVAIGREHDRQVD